MRIYRKADRVTVVSESEVLVMFVTPNCENTATNNFEKKKEEIEKLRLAYI